MNSKTQPRVSPLKSNTIKDMNSSYLSEPSNLTTYQTCIFLKSGKTYKRVKFNDIIHVKALGAYCIIKTRIKDYTLSSSLKKVLDQLKFSRIIRCHRSYAVNINHIDSFDDTGVTLILEGKEIEIPVSISYRSDLLKELPRMRSS